MRKQLGNAVMKGGALKKAQTAIDRVHGRIKRSLKLMTFLR